MSIVITVAGQGVGEALARLAERAERLSPLLAVIGEGIVGRADDRFGRSAGPDGHRWAANSPVTMAREALRLAISKSNRTKSGGLNAKGRKALAAKRPLIGESRALMGSNWWHAAGGNAVEFGNSAVYAAIQQFGGQRAEFPHLWGDIPARPFLPVTPAGDLYPAEAAAIVADLNDYFGSWDV